MKRKKTYLIDANSQFTRLVDTSCQVYHTKFGKVEELIESKEYRFGHYVFGRNHNDFAIILNDLAVERKQEIARDIYTKSKEFSLKNRARFPGISELPDLILIPAESSAANFSEVIAATFPSSDICFLNRAYSNLGSVDYHLEPRPIALYENTRLSSGGFLNVLFFDDSLSSGDTEEIAVNALYRSLYNISLKAKHTRIAWLSYTILIRQQGYQRIFTSATGITNIRGKKVEFLKKRLGYTNVPNRSFLAHECLFCNTLDRVNLALSWTADVSPNLSSTLYELKNYLSPKYAEYRGHGPELFPPGVSIYFCNLYRKELHDICFHFTHGEPPDQNAALARVLFCCMNYHDVRAYLSNSAILSFLEHYINPKSNPCPLLPQALLFSLALCPVPFIYNIITRIDVAGHFLSRSPMAYYALVSIFFPNHFDIIRLQLKATPAFPYHWKGPLQQEFATGELIATLDHLRGDPEKFCIGEESLSLMRMHTLALATAPQGDSAVSLIRKISIRLHRGAHDSFLYRKLINMDADSAAVIIDEVRHTLKLLRMFYALIGLEESARIDESLFEVSNIKTQIPSSGTVLNRTGSTQPIVVALLGILDKVWTNSETLSRYLYHDLNFGKCISDCVYAIGEKVEFRHSYLSKSMSSIIRFRTTCYYDSHTPAPAPWTILCLNYPDLTEHIVNLLSNPFYHWDHDAPAKRVVTDRMTYLSRISADICANSAPVVAACFSVNYQTQTVDLMVADRAVLFNFDKIIIGTGNLSLAKARLADVGATLSKVDLVNGLCLDSYPAFTGLIAREFAHLYHNLIITCFPIVIESRI